MPGSIETLQAGGTARIIAKGTVGLPPDAAGQIISDGTVQVMAVLTMSEGDGSPRCQRFVPLPHGTVARRKLAVSLLNSGTISLARSARLMP